MSTRVAICHRIGYEFHRELDSLTLWLRLRPAPHTTAQVEAYSIKVHAEPNWLNWLRDPFENHLGRLDLPEATHSCSFDVESIAELTPVNPFDFFVEPFAYHCPFEYPDQLRKELAPYLHLEPVGGDFSGWVAGLDRSARYVVEYLTLLNTAVHERFDTLSPATASGLSAAAQPLDLDAVVKRGAGTAWELAWVLTQSLRHVGLAARFTSGYLISLADDSEELDRARMHAWSEVFIPGAGWIGLDPSTGIFTAERHVPLASAPDPFRTLPVVGIEQQLVASSCDELQIRRLTPISPSKPISETHWRDILATGRYIDDALQTEQLALCSSAEVNFISAANDTAPEWTCRTLGDDKRHAAQTLLNRLKAKWSPGGAIHLCQGEHIRGEATARWRMSCYYRADGRPLWRNPGLLAGPECSIRRATTNDARQFAGVLAKSMGLNESAVVAAYEDRLHQFWTDISLSNFRPQDAELRDPLQRQALADRLSAGAENPTGYVLPLRWDFLTSRWASGKWKFRRAGLYLIPGDFPLGFRLPLDSLEKESTLPDEIAAEPSPLEDKPLLADVHGEASARQSIIGPAHEPPAYADSDQEGLAPRTALCVQARSHTLYVFLPPIHHVEHYVELIAAIESTAESLGLPIVLEGYEPPLDSRLRRFVFEPDNGLLRLFLPAAANWQEQRELYETAYSEAGAVGLRSPNGDQRDGTRQRPNSGTTLTLGGAKPSESPFLKRPQLLRSLIAYWQNHPSLSYFFAGTQIGPSGDTPRPDEGRDDALYELGIALSRFPSDKSAHLWVPDRLLRHLLADASGNMHRAEIRVDQLYAPERQSKRLGQIMLHSFDMPPSAPLASLQALLVRAIIAGFARRPYMEPLIAWQNDLHDRFMLPLVLWEDLGTIIDELGEAGLPLQQDWFAPIVEMNFPILGCTQIGDITLELRRAHEPWPLLAEEVAGGGNARFIDVANERIQVRVGGLPPDRYVLSCNQQSVPLQTFTVQGQYVAGVRYKVCQPPSTLHPTIAPVSTLVFDLIDTWTGRAVGGCTYYPAPPQTWTYGVAELPAPADYGGRRQIIPPPPIALAATPVAGRFSDQGSGVGPKDTPNPANDGRSPYLLDLTCVAAETGDRYAT